MRQHATSVLLVLIVCTVAGMAEERTGVIDGTVVYEDGRPAKGATVYAVPLGRPMLAIIPHNDTDDAGHFAIRVSRSWFGKFVVAAKKEDEDYPDMSNQFYSDGKFETVRLTSRHPTANLKIRLGPKAGVLVGTVTDADTGAGLDPCVYFARASEPNSYLLATGLVKAKYRVLVPSNTDVLMKIWHEGYKPWYYPGTFDRSESQPLRLKPGEEQILDIRLQPGKISDDAGCGMPIDAAGAQKTMHANSAPR